MSRNILLIDDEILLTSSLKDFLEDYDYIVRIAENGQEGLICIEESIPDIVIVDLNMPVMDGYEFTRRVTKLYPNLPIVVLSGVGLIDDAMRAVRNGAWDFIAKPLSDMQVVFYTIDKCLEKAKLLEENERYHRGLESLVLERTRQLERTKRQILSCLGKAAEFKDNETGFHVVRVARMSFVLARGMGLESGFCRIIRETSPMHDVGKIGIHDSVLLKQGKLNSEEWQHMKQHSRYGCSILSSGDGGGVADDLSVCESLLKEDGGDELLTVAQRIALFHHETWEGSGYPCGLAGEMIPVEARIVSLVDVYDAVSSKRPYKEAFPEDKCQDILRKGAGTQFDPAVVAAFFDNLDVVLKIKNQFYDQA